MSEIAIEEREPDYNVTPRAMVPDRAGPPPRKGVEGPPKRALTMVRWGLVPSWAESTADRRQADQRPGRDRHREGRPTSGRSHAPLHRPRRRVLRVAAVEEHVDQASAAPAVLRAPPRRRAARVRGAVGDLARPGDRRRRRSRRVGALVRDRHDARQRAARADPRPHAGDARRDATGTRGSIPRPATSARSRRCSRPRPTSGSRSYPVSTRVNTPDNNDAELVAARSSPTRCSVASRS